MDSSERHAKTIDRMKGELVGAFDRAIWYKDQFGPHGEVPKGQEEEYRRVLHEEIALGTFIASALDVLTREPSAPRNGPKPPTR
jgi:hypothetical protein